MNDAFLHGDAAARKEAQMAEGLLWYFPDALACVANVSKRGNDQHNPGQPLHHARGKSTDHADCIIRHLAHAGARDSDGVRETAKVVWRALALLQEEIERDCGVPIPRNAKAQREWERGKPKTASIRNAGEFTQPPNCVHESIKSTNLGHVELVDSAHPMQAEALRMADEQPCNQPRPFGESAWAVTWPGYQTLVGN